MFTIRNSGGIALLLAGSSWLWLTPAFASPGVSTSEPLWAITSVLCLITVGAFCVATWGVFSRRSWWEVVALGSAALGLISLVAYWLAAYARGERVGTGTWNVFVHVLMVAGVFALLRVPHLERWVDHHVVSG